jgi:hypothetical protein
MLQWLQDEFNPHFHLVLAQVYLKDDAYAEFFRGRVVNGDEVLLDQGAAELGAAIKAEHLIKVVRELRPSIVVAPDVVYVSVETIYRTRMFLQDYLGELKSLGVKVLAVPQGEDVPSYCKCFRLFNSAQEIDWLGISKFYHIKFRGRTELLSLVKNEVAKPCHLLGVYNKVSDLSEEKFSFIKSVDTAKPIKLGLQGLSLGETDKRQPMSDFFSRPPTNLGLVKQNIEEYLSIVEGA